MDNYNAYTSFDYQDRERSAVQNVTIKTFAYMFFALIVSGVFSVITYTTGNAEELVVNGTWYVLAVIELITVLVTTLLIKRNMAAAAAVSGTIYCILNGLTLSVIFLAYQMQSILSIFFISAAIFGAMALYGATTKRDLTGIGGICTMALIGLILVTIINLIFLRSSGLDLALAYIGVLIFVGLTAFDTQKIRKLTTANIGLSPYTIAIYCALNLYLDFINIFLKLLYILGKRN